MLEKNGNIKSNQDEKDTPRFKKRMTLGSTINAQASRHADQAADTQADKPAETEQDSRIGFYSFKLGRPFKTKTELLDAEKTALEAEKAKAEAEEKAKAAVKAKNEERAQDAKAVREKLEAVLNLEKDYQIAHRKAYDEYIAARNEFVKKYGSYHESYYTSSPVQGMNIWEFLDKNLPSFGNPWWF